MTTLSREDAWVEFEEAVKAIKKFSNQYPINFAFPNHDYNTDLLDQARTFHLETRNTLYHSLRYSIKTRTEVVELIQAVNDATANGINLVFSGHSTVTESEINNGEKGEGYEPIRIEVLKSFLSKLKQFHKKVEIVTFRQASIREFIRAGIEEKNILQNDDLIRLKRFEILDEIIKKYQ